MADEFTVKLTIGDATVEVTGDRRGVVEVVKELAEVLRKPQLALGPGPPVEEAGPSPAPREETPQPLAPEVAPEPALALNARELFAQKQPSTMIEAAVVATYYATMLAPEDERVEAIDNGALEEVFRLAGRRLPSRTQQLLVDTYTAGFLNRVGRGRYTLNNVGQNLVVHTLGAEPSVRSPRD